MSSQTEHCQTTHWWPVTYDFGLIKTSAEAAANRLFDLLKEHDAQLNIEAKDAPLSSIFDALQPLQMPYNKRLFVETDFGWSAYFTNGGNGSDPFPAMSLLACDLDVMAMRICSSPPDLRYPAVIWEVYGGATLSDHPTGYIRSIAAANDGGRWVYETSGAAFPFEDPKASEAKRKKDRFSREMLAQYLAEFGIPPLSDERLASGGSARAYLLSRPAFDQARAYDLETAKRNLLR